MPEQQAQSAAGESADLQNQSDADQVTIADQAAQHKIDVRTILGMNALNVADQRRIIDLEQQIRLDQEIIELLAEQGTIAQDQIENLNLALANCRKIGAAVGIVMAANKVDSEGAFRILRKASQNNNRKLADIADEVVFTGALEV